MSNAESLGRERECFAAALNLLEHNVPYRDVRDRVLGEFIDIQPTQVYALVEEALQSLTGPVPSSNGKSPLHVWDASDDTRPPPPRGWLLGNIFCRRFVSALLADGGVGKTALRMAQLISLAIGRSLTGEHVFHRSRVLLVSFEDDEEELKRRVWAVRKYYGVTEEELRGWLFLAAPGRHAGKILTDRDGTLVDGPLLEVLRRVIEDRKIDLLSLDPFVKSHGVNENDNNAIDQVVGLLTDLAHEYDIAIDLLHHTRKGAAEPGDADRGRGATSMKDAGRLVFTLTRMSHAEAADLDISDKERRSLIRMDAGKVNITPRAEDARWYRLIGITIGNETDEYPNGDSVQTVESWEPPDMWAGLTISVCNEVLTTIEAGLPEGERYSGAPSAKERAAWPVVIHHAEHKTERQAREVIRSWVESGVLVEKYYHSTRRRKEIQGLYVDHAKRPR